MRENKLNDVFPAWHENGGIFAGLQALDVPWASAGISAELDLEYHGNNSGCKCISPLLMNLSSGGPLTESALRLITSTIVALYGEQWHRQWETLSFQYDPIQNYSMLEEMTDDETINQYGKTRTRTNNLSHTKTGTETDTPNTTETETPNLTNTRRADTHGFNSSAPVSTDGDTESATGTNTVTRTGQEQRTYNTTDSDTGTQTDNDGGRDTSTRNYKLSRRGNIGVTTSQQMIESERNLWMWNFFHAVVFPDLDRTLTLSIY